MSWIFGYGSLIWRPGFAFGERRAARLEGYSRSFCRLSFYHRGTPQAPGMVVGLVPGGCCQGVAYRVGAGEEEEVLSYLDDREGAGYRRHPLPILLEPADQPEGEGIGLRQHRAKKPRAGEQHTEETGAAERGAPAAQARAWVYLPEPGHPSYAPDLPEARIVELIADGEGESGTARDYLRDLIAALATLGVNDPRLPGILAKVEQARNGRGEFRGGTVETPAAKG